MNAGCKLIFSSLLILFTQTGYTQNRVDCSGALYFEAIELLQNRDTASAQQELIELFSKTNYGDLSVHYNLYVSKSVKSHELNKLLTVSAIQKGCDIEFFNNLLKKSGFDTISVESDLYQINNKIYLSKLDSFMIKELKWMEERDQAIRMIETETPELAQQMKYIDSTNMLLLHGLIRYNNYQWPGYDQLGSDGSSYLKTILYHFDVENINEVMPYIITAIKNNQFFNAETILYQVDRNVAGSNELYLYDSNTKMFNIVDDYLFLHPRLGNYQYYGGIDLFDSFSKELHFWPINPNRDMNIVQSLLDDLCLPLNNPLKSRVKTVDAQSFIEIASKY